jgi:hypothetical protein
MRTTKIQSVKSINYGEVGLKRRRSTAEKEIEIEASNSEIPNDIEILNGFCFPLIGFICGLPFLTNSNPRNKKGRMEFFAVLLKSQVVTNFLLELASIANLEMKYTSTISLVKCLSLGYDEPFQVIILKDICLIGKARLWYVKFDDDPNIVVFTEMILLEDDLASGNRIPLDELRKVLNNGDFDLLAGGDEKVEIGEKQRIASRSMDEEFEESQPPRNRFVLGPNQRIVPRYCSRANRNK